MDTKDVFFVLLLCYSLILIKCVGNELSKVVSDLADAQNEMLRKLPGELLAKGQLKRNVRQADKNIDMLSATQILSNALTEIIEVYPTWTATTMSTITPNAPSNQDPRKTQVTLDHLDHKE